MEFLLPIVAVIIIACFMIALFHLLEFAYNAAHGKKGGCPYCGKKSYLTMVCDECYYEKGLR